MTSPDERLDPDEVTCPTCGQPPGQVCRQPSGVRARAIHAARRRAADNPVPVATPNRTPRPGQSNLTPEGRAKGGKASAQARRRRAAEAAALVEQRRADAEAKALAAEAEKLAADATRYARDRALLTRKTLDAALGATDRLVESLRDLKVVELDDDRIPKTTPVEETDREGRTRVREVPVVTGSWTTRDVELLARAASTALASLRLEEGKPTGITRDEGAGASEVLGERGVEDLLTWAANNLRRNE